MKKILSLILILIFSLSIGMTTSAKYYTLEEATDELSKVEKASFVNEDGWYYKVVNDVALYVKLEKEHYVVGDTLTYNVKIENFSDKCVGVEFSMGNEYFFDFLNIDGKSYKSDRLILAVGMPFYEKTYGTNGQQYTFWRSTDDEYFDSAIIKKAGIYTLGVIADFKFGEFDETKNPNKEDSGYFTSTDNESHKIVLAIDIPVYESEADIQNIEIPVVAGPEKTKQSYYEKYPETPTSVLHEEPITVATTEVTTTENTTAAPTEAVKQDASIIPSWIGYIIIALSVGVIITAVIIFVVVNKKKK